MPSIYLGKQSGMYYTDRSFIVVDEQPYSGSNMFRKFQHKPTTYFTPGFIYLFKGNVLYINFWENRAILQPDSDYYDAALKEVDVYYNRFDSSNTPLVCVLKFNNPRNNRKFQDRIYRLSKDGYLIDQNRYAVLSILPSFTGDPEKELLEILLKESDTHLKTISYELNRTNPSNSEIEYASQNILLSPIKPVKGYNSNEFYKYTHKYRYNRPKKSLLLYNNNAPMFDNNNFVQYIQTEEYDTVNVYYSNELNTPLLIEFMNRGRKSHIQRLNQDDSKWTRNDIQYSNEETLISYLRAISRRVKEKKEEEQQKRDRERRKPTPETKRTLTPKRIGGQESIITQRTEGQGSSTTQTRQNIQEPTRSSSEEEFQADAPDTSFQGQKPRITGQMCVLIDKQTEYKKLDVETICKSADAGSKIQNVQPETISVLPIDQKDIIGKNIGYKYFIHLFDPDLSKLNGKGKEQDIVIELKIYISSIDISFFDGNKPRTNLNYNMSLSKNSLYVYFYEHNTKPQKTDTVPLMIYLNGTFYGPSKHDSYFTGWNRIDGIAGISDELKIKERLNSINKELNKIELSEKGGDKCGYGIPKLPGIDIKDFDTDRVKVTIHKKENYTRVVHRTINSFTIGDICYGTDDISKGTITIKGTGGRTGSSIITFDTRKNHTQFVTDHSPNTVVSYYSSEDKTYKLPQLIVLMTTDQAIPESVETLITASPSSKYGYYVLATADNGGSYKYEWRTVNDVKPDPFKLDDPTEYSLLNAIVILVDKQQEYQETAIKAAVQTATIKSPGNEEGVNRLKDRTINPHEETGASASRYGEPGKCVSKYGYRLWAHDITSLVEWKPTTSQTSSIALIGGFRFLVPSSKTDGEYEEINLYKNEGATDPVDRLYHIPKENSNSSQNKVYVFFYEQDSRPLLLCYGENAYKPKKPTDPIPEMQVIMDYSKWTRVTGISQCTCLNNRMALNDENILNTLLDVVCFLNPVQINPKEIPTPASTTITATKPPESPKEATYELHKFTENKTVKMKITRTDVHCYEQYKYEPYGTSNDGNGFRLGNVFHAKTTKSNVHSHLEYSKLRTTFPYDPVVGVSVFYYDHDEQYDEPLLIELDFKVSSGAATYKEYYKLESVGNTLRWDFDDKAKENIGDCTDIQKIVSYLDTIRYPFKNVLQVCVAIKQSTQYSANLLDRNNGNPVKSEQIQVTVNEESNCGFLTETGFRCFRHEISTLESQDLHKIGGLEFLIPHTSRQQVKLNLYDTPSTGLIHPLYYNCSMGDIYVYFYGGGVEGHVYGDPRPLLLCYNKTSYRAFSILLYDSQIWYKAPKVKNCVCDNNNLNNLLVALVLVSNFLNRVQIQRHFDGPYTVHKFNGEDIKIHVTVKPSKDKFCYNKYTHRHLGSMKSEQNGQNPNPSEGVDGVQAAEGFRLGSITYSGESIEEWPDIQASPVKKPVKRITSLTTDKPNYCPASEVVVYYYRGDPTHRNPLLVALCKKNNGCTQNAIDTSTTSTCKCQPYYELQRSSIMTTKMYKKSDNTITLEERPGTELEKILDKILYYVSNSILIDLGFPKTNKPNTIKRPEKHCTTTWTGSYTSKVYENIENKPKKTSRNINVNVCGPFDITNPSGKKTGYQCYRHKISIVQNVDQIGGLKLFLWDNRRAEEQDKGFDECKTTPPTKDNKRPCCEITLWESCNQDSKTQAQEIKPIAYTTCKGDLYVYFYGSDPRPLLLCYNGEAYRPSELISI